MTELVQIPDGPTTDTDIVRLITTGQANLVPLFTYLVSESDEGKFFLQVSSPNRNLSRFSPDPFETISLSQMLALIEDRGYDKDSLVSDIRFYEAEVLAQLDTDDRPQTPLTRPSTGSVAQLATTAQVIGSLQLPTVKSDEINNFRIGRLARSGEATVPIIIPDKLLNHHILVAGATGSGKSNLLSNLAHIADIEERCVVLFDHKPDHQNHHEENTDTEIIRKFNLPKEENRGGSGIVRYWTLDQKDPNANSRLLRVPAWGLDSEVLAGTIFHRANEENQAETFAAIAAAYSESSEKEDWTIHELVTFVRDKPTAAIKGLFKNSDTPLHSSTLEAIKRKLIFGGRRIPSFIDSQPAIDALGKETHKTGEVDEVFEAGLNVIRIGEDDARGYGLFLSHLLQHAADKRALSIQHKATIPKMLIIIDEAADIFKADSRYLRNAATGILAERIRKGRSLQIGYIIAVQNAGDVPQSIRHNLNTTMVGRHRHLDTLREALPTVREGLLSNADKLGPGEMLVDLFGVNSLLLVKMDQSRSKLTVAT